MIGLLCAMATIIVHYLSQHDTDSIYNIEVSLSALSLDHDDEPHSSNHSSTSSWFSELDKLDLLNVDSSLPVTMDTGSKQIISPPKLRLRRTFSPHWDDKIRQIHHSTITHRRHYIIITLSCLLSVSVTCNVILLFYCLT